MCLKFYVSPCRYPDSFERNFDSIECGVAVSVIGMQYRSILQPALVCFLDVLAVGDWLPGLSYELVFRGCGSDFKLQASSRRKCGFGIYFSAGAFYCSFKW